MQNIDSSTHTRGESIYLDDIPLINGTLFGVAFGSPIAHGIIKNVDLTAALQSEGVVKILTAKDIIGENEIGGIIPDEPLFANHHVHFIGMPIAFIVAESEAAARAAIKKITIEIEPLPVITDPREAKEKGELIIPPRTFQIGNINNIWSD
mgnify:CR=1 FL=1